jgi:hypothetical protein
MYSITTDRPWRIINKMNTERICENCDEREGEINSAIWVSIGEIKGHWVCWECEVDFIEEDERRKEESERAYSNRLVDRRNR